MEIVTDRLPTGYAGESCCASSRRGGRKDAHIREKMKNQRYGPHGLIPEGCYI